MASVAAAAIGFFVPVLLLWGKFDLNLPRVWAQLQRNLVALDLAPLTELCDSLLPKPNATALETITRQCAQHPPP
mgnify:CR=1 FL=1